MSGSTVSDDQKSQPKIRRTPEEHWEWQAADHQGAALGLEILDEVRASNSINRGQKHLQKLLELKNRLLFGKDAVDAVTIPEDDTRINCPEIHNHYGKTPAPTASPGLSAAKIALGAVLAGTGIGAGIGIPLALSGVLDSAPAVVQPAEPKSDAPTVNIGGKEYELSLEPE